MAFFMGVIVLNHNSHPAKLPLWISWEGHRVHQSPGYPCSSITRLSALRTSRAAPL